MGDKDHVKSPVASHVKVVTASNQNGSYGFSPFSMFAVEYVARTLQTVSRL